MAWTVFRSVESNRSLRFSRRETPSWVIPNFFAIRTCVSFRAWRSSRKVISSAISAAARASTFLRCAKFSDLVFHVVGHDHLFRFFSLARCASKRSSALRINSR